MSKHQDNNVFLIMAQKIVGGTPVDVSVSAVVAENEEAAKKAFSERYPDFEIVTYPNLAQFKQTVEFLEKVKNKETIKITDFPGLKSVIFDGEDVDIGKFEI